MQMRGIASIQNRDGINAGERSIQRLTIVA